MTPIVLQYSDMTGLLPLAQIVGALDDDGDKEADEAVWDAVLASANGRLAAAVQDDEPAEAEAAWALKLFVAQILFDRNGFSDSRNPYSAQAKAAEERLRALAEGKELSEADAEGNVFTEPIAMKPTGGRLL